MSLLTFSFQHPHTHPTADPASMRSGWEEAQQRVCTHPLTWASWGGEIPQKNLRPLEEVATGVPPRFPASLRCPGSGGRPLAHLTFSICLDTWRGHWHQPTFLLLRHFVMLFRSFQFPLGVAPAVVAGQGPSRAHGACSISHTLLLCTGEPGGCPGLTGALVPLLFPSLPHDTPTPGLP